MPTPCEEKKWWINSGRMGWRETSSTRALRGSDAPCPDSGRSNRKSLIQSINRGEYGKQRNK